MNGRTPGTLPRAPLPHRGVKRQFPQQPAGGSAPCRFQTSRALSGNSRKRTPGDSASSF